MLVSRGTCKANTTFWNSCTILYEFASQSLRLLMSPPGDGGESSSNPGSYHIPRVLARLKRRKISITLCNSSSLRFERAAEAWSKVNPANAP